MACFHPLEAVQEGGGRVVVGHGVMDRVAGRPLWLPCGRCIGCRLVRQRSLALRCVHEAQMHSAPSSFVTLTYAGACGPSLEYRDFQKFMYRLRRRCGPTRFLVGGEYGEQGSRPHFHCILFGRSFPRDYVVKGDAYGSSLLDKLWGHGYASHGACTYESARYVASYCVSKRTGDLAVDHYRRVDLVSGEIVDVRPEFGRMSLKPGLGSAWFAKYWKEVFIPGVRAGVVMRGGTAVPPPRFYQELLSRLPEDAGGEYSSAVEFDAYVRAAGFAADCAPARLVVRERCALAKERFLKRRSL